MGLLLLWLPAGWCLRLPEGFGKEVGKLFVEVGRDGLSTVKFMGDFRDMSAVSDLEILNDSFPFLANRVFLLRRQAKGRVEMLGRATGCAVAVRTSCPRGQPRGR